MLAALRLLFHLGIRRLYLLGCDFHMRYGEQNYAFPQARTRESVRGNNRAYHVLDARFHKLRPYFHREDYRIFNCTPQSGLTAFPYLPFDAAVVEARKNMPGEIITKGMYDAP